MPVSRNIDSWPGEGTHFSPSREGRGGGRGIQGDVKERKKSAYRGELDIFSLQHSERPFAFIGGETHDPNKFFQSADPTNGDAHSGSEAFFVVILHTLLLALVHGDRSRGDVFLDDVARVER